MKTMGGSLNQRLARTGLVLCAIFVLTGCKEVLYSNLAEADANEMTTILQTSGVDVSRKRDKDGVYEILVAPEDVARASSLLIGNGLPRKKFVSMDQVFDAQGLVGSPFEERVRYIFALEEKLTEHLVSIHGVRDARVSISIPEKSRFGKETTKSSASIILHHEPQFIVNGAVPKIKTLVASAIQNLDYEAVSVVVFPAQTNTLIAPVSGPALTLNAANAAGFSDIPREQNGFALGQSISGLWMGIGIFAVLFLLVRSIRSWGV